MNLIKQTVLEQRNHKHHEAFFFPFSKTSAEKSLSGFQEVLRL